MQLEVVWIREEFYTHTAVIWFGGAHMTSHVRKCLEKDLKDFTELYVEKKRIHDQRTMISEGLNHMH